MSSEEPEDFNENGSDKTHRVVKLKKRRHTRACDFCRRRKIRCDGAELAGASCTNCVAYGSECKYGEDGSVGAGKSSKGQSSKEYVEYLEKRLADMELALVRNLQAEEKKSEGKGVLNPGSSAFLASTGVYSICPLLPPASSAPPGERSKHDSLIDDPHLPLSELHNGFYGKSSDYVMAQKAMEVKREYAGNENIHQVPSSSSIHRAEFWTVRPWELSVQEPPPQYVLPDSSLMEDLITLFFSEFNSLWPVLHAPTFQRSLADGLHLRDHLFGGTVLLVLALGSRYSNDPRVFLENANSTNSSGWKWFSQARMTENRGKGAAKLYEIQQIILSIFYLMGTSTPEDTWTLHGLAIRLAQAAGAHRRKPIGYTMTQEDEIWKRNFWVLVCLDKFMSSFLGRPRGMHDEDFDVDYPIECDDEYWDSQPPFKQPANKPSKMAFFTAFLQLYEILGIVLKMVYPVNKNKVALCFARENWEQEVVAQLDSALNHWVDSVPNHLRWDPHQKSRIFLHQSATLYATYYHIQILVHRPFIPSTNNPSPLTFPSLAICANAARSCCHILSALNERGIQPTLNTLNTGFASGVMLLLNIWSGKRSGIVINAYKEMKDVEKCMKMLEVCEKRFHPAGRLRDVLRGLAAMGEISLPPSPKSQKRGRDEDISAGTYLAEASSSNASTAGDNISSQPEWNQTQLIEPNLAADNKSLPQNPPTAFPIPMHSNELGRMPLHGGFDFSFQIPPIQQASSQAYTTEATSSLSSLDDQLLSADHPITDLDASFIMDQDLYDQMARLFAGGDATRSSWTFAPLDQIPMSLFDVQLVGTDGKS